MGIILDDNHKFICAECGCSFWESSLTDGSPNSGLTRYCSGDGCDYWWLESEDEDHLYQKVIMESGDEVKDEHFDGMEWLRKRMNRTAPLIPESAVEVIPSEVVKTMNRVLDQNDKILAMLESLGAAQQTLM
jgi:hypothetical protein